MKLTVTCRICGKILSEVEKDSISDIDIDSYEASSSCETDGPFQEYDEEGLPLPMDNSNIIAVKTLE